MIDIRSVHKFFNKGKSNEIHVTDDVSLDLPEKGMVAIFGQSGCGKTTLLNIIGGLDRFDEGTVTIEGKDIQKNTDEIRNRYIGYIFQNYNLNKEESCFDNVADALKLCGVTDSLQIKERVTSALISVGMEKYANRTPDTLSGGQQQRIAIARAIVKNPHIILADEPTGNLDENNTIMIMDLLKRFARNRLVLIVTHEAHLVDYYCDMVVELRDGKVIDKRNNFAANGYAVRDKNHIFLGELEKSELSNENTRIEYYGAPPKEPIKLKIINNDGKLYIQIDTPKVQLLDETSEVQLQEGVFKGESVAETVAPMEIAELPSIEGKKYGKLFSFFSSLKSGYVSNFKNIKKRGKLLHICMGLFAVVLVLVTAFFGTVFGTLIDVEYSYNHNVFYVEATTPSIAEKLKVAAESKDSGIEYVRPIYYKPVQELSIKINYGSFETAYGGYLYTNVTALNVTLAKNMTLVQGKNTDLKENEAIITTAVADAWLESCPVSYISEYKDLLGRNNTICNYSTVFFEYTCRLVGIVRSEERSIYFSDMGMARFTTQNNKCLSYGKDYGMDIEPGKATLVNLAGYRNLPSIGETIKIQGREITVGEVIEVDNYASSDDDISNSDDNITKLVKQLDDNGIYTYTYLLNEADYVAVANGIGETHKSVLGTYGDGLYMYGNGLYVLVYSSNTSKTKNYFQQNSYFDTIITPESIRSDLIESYALTITVGITSLIIICGIMSLCMYFIMHSSLMNRIKEVGIYRAIGVSKKNILFKFFIEAALLTTLTVFVGYFCCSIFLWVCLSSSSLVGNVFYYPAWLSILLLILIYAVCLFCGLLPVFNLLRKQPSEILAKYDI